MQEQRSRLIRVNSRFKEDTVPASNTQFSVQLGERSIDRCMSIMLVSCSFPRLFPNIFAPISAISYQIGAGVFVDYVVTTAQYTATELAVALDTLLPDISVAYVAERFTFATALASVTIATSGLAPYIGITAPLTITNAGPVDSPSPPQLQLAQVYVESQYVASVNCLDSVRSAQFIDVIQAIDQSAVPQGFNTAFHVKTEHQSLISFPDQTSLRQVDIRLTDVYGNVLVLPDSCYVDLLFRVTYSQD